MVDVYVSQLGGDDSNNGLTLATAKQTLAGMLTISSGTDFYIYPGEYTATSILLSSIGENDITLNGIGKAIITGENLAIGMFDGGNSVASLEVRGFEFKNCLDNCLIIESEQETVVIENNIFYNMHTGINAGTYTLGEYTVRNNTFYNCHIGAKFGAVFSPGFVLIENNTFYNCKYGYQWGGAGGSSSVDIQHNIFMNNEVALSAVDISELGDTDYNIYYGPGGFIIAIDDGATEYTDLAAWTVATNEDHNSIVADPLFANPSWGIFSVLPGSPAESGNGQYIGAHKTELGWYNTDQMSSGLSLTDTEIFDNNIIGSGLKLINGAESGIIELGAMDLGQVYDVSKIFTITKENLIAGRLIDSSLSDNTSTSGQYTIEVRTSDTAVGILSASYETYDLRSEISPGEASGRYIQARIVLNR